MTAISASERRRITAQMQGNERAFLDQVLQAATMFGWLAYHPWLSKHSQRGWPDLALLRGSRLVLAELKSETGQPTIEQAVWLEGLAAVLGIEVYLWRPSDLETIVQTLR